MLYAPYISLLRYHIRDGQERSLRRGWATPVFALRAKRGSVAKGLQARVGQVGLRSAAFEKEALTRQPAIKEGDQPRVAFGVGRLHEPIHRRIRL